MKIKALAISTFLMILMSVPFALAQKGGRKYRNYDQGFYGYGSYYDGYSGYGDYRSLPPGLRKHLMKRGTLPPGIQKRIGPYRYYDRPHYVPFHGAPHYVPVVPLPRPHSRVRIFVEF